MNVLLELCYGFCAESVGYGFALARMLGTITSIEEATVNGDEGVIVVAKINSYLCKEVSCF